MNGARIVRGVLAAAVAAAMFGVSGCTSASQPPASGGSAGEKAPYKIGAVLSLTGTYSGLGTPEKNTIDMEVARINDAGGINGHQLEVVVEDDGTDAGKATAAATKLIDQEKVLAILGATGTGQTMAIRQAVDRAGIPQVSMAGGTVITAKFDKLVFQTPWSNTLIVPFVLKHMQGKGLKTVALLTDSGAYGKDGLAVLEKNLAAFGMTAVAKETFNPGDTDMTAQLTKISAAKPDAVILWNAGKEAAIVIKNREQLKLTVPFFGGSGQGRVEFIDGADSAADHFVFGTGKDLVLASWGTSSEEYKVTKDFVDRYTAKYGKAPDIFAGHAYDALNITIEAMKKLPEGFTPAQLRDEIEKTSGLVGMGGSFTFSPTDHNGLTEKDLQMYVVENGTFAILGAAGAQ